MSKYQVEIKEIGESASLMLEEQSLILFNEQAPDELREYSVITSSGSLKAPIEAGDYLNIGELTFKVTAVGSVANENIDQLGHVTLRFDGSLNAQLPGHIHLEPQLIDFSAVEGNIRIE